jgi:hypothetical protein
VKKKKNVKNGEGVAARGAATLMFFFSFFLVLFFFYELYMSPLPFVLKIMCI